MKFNTLIKAIPLLSTLLLITFLSISNQKEYTRLRLLVWNTPSLTLGTYLSISIGTGFIISYLITTNLAKVYAGNANKPLRYKGESKYEESNEISDTFDTLSSENTLIHRDFKDPLPTIKANFRVIERREKKYPSSINNSVNNVNLNEFEEPYYEKPYKNEISTQMNSSSDDWSDESYSRW
ncbi:hypothetical protein [Prochlorococcus marinus]|uniref:hypothetical protein n=1 Tax=Prochlorococcus marinus TaxID=1219 RepID=UPI0022B44A9A|nr:hypothetical protein [Prochlorococcus marinus]